MNPATYFQVIMFILMALSFIALVLIFLHMIYGKEEEEEA